MREGEGVRREGEGKGGDDDDGDVSREDATVPPLSFKKVADYCDSLWIATVLQLHAFRPYIITRMTAAYNSPLQPSGFFSTAATPNITTLSHSHPSLELP